MLCIYDEIITSDFEFGNPTSKKKKIDIDLNIEFDICVGFSSI